MTGIDELTGLPNRASHIAESDLWSDRGSGALILIDLDQFRQVNDTLGNAVGDEVLRLAAQRLTQAGPFVHLARVSGDEFACLVESDGIAALALAKRFVEVLSEPLSINQMTVYAGVSVGVAMFGEVTNADETRRRAGVALEEAKRSGSCARRYDEVLEEKCAKAYSLASDLPEALAQRDFIMHYQPKFDLLTGDVVGFEALARWQHPIHRLLPPASFLDLVSVGGLHSQLFQVTLEQSLADFAVLRKTNPLANLAVNVHPRNLREPDLVSRTLEALSSFDISPSSLTLELTEDSLINEDRFVERTINAFDCAGVMLSADDFGTGYSSLSYLNRLPVKEIKLDRSLISEVTQSRRAEAVVKSMLALAEQLGLSLVAEGIEDRETLTHLIGMGCPQGQGFYLGHPNSVDHWAQVTSQSEIALTADV